MDIEYSADDKQTDMVYCSNCKRDIQASNYQIHVVHCERRIILCPTCNEPVPRTEMEEHYQENHVEVSCDLCRQRIAKDHLEQHQSEDCPQRMIACEYCDLEVKAIDFQEHIAACGSRTDICDKCLQRVMLQNMKNHHENECGKPLSVAAHNPYRATSRPVAMGGAVGINIGGLYPREPRRPYITDPSIPTGGIYGNSPSSSRRRFLDNEPTVDSVTERSSEENQRLLSDEEVAVQLQQQFLREEDSAANTHSDEPSPYYTRVPATINNNNDQLLPSDNLLTQQLQMEEAHGTRGQPTMVIYNRSLMESQEGQDDNEITNTAPTVSSHQPFPDPSQPHPYLPRPASPHEPSPPPVAQEEDDDEEKKQRQLAEDEEMARLLQEREDEETRKIYDEVYNPKPGPLPPSHSPTHSPTPTCTAVETEEEVTVPCEICKKAVPFDRFQFHMEEVHPRMLPYFAVTQPTRPVSPPSPHETDETVTEKEEPSNEISCRYCSLRYTDSVIKYHETVCDMNPDIDLKHIQVSSATPYIKEDEEHEEPNDASSDETELDGLPCQFCNKLFPLEVFDNHQRTCSDRFHPRNLERPSRDYRAKREPTHGYGAYGNRDHLSKPTEDTVACNYCQELFPMHRISSHEQFFCKERPRRYPPSDSRKSTATGFTARSTEKIVNCPDCNELVPLHSLAKHKETECRKQPQKPYTSASSSSGYTRTKTTIGETERYTGSRYTAGAASAGRLTSTSDRTELLSTQQKMKLTSDPKFKTNSKSHLGTGNDQGMNTTSKKHTPSSIGSATYNTRTKENSKRRAYHGAHDKGDEEQYGLIIEGESDDVEHMEVEILPAGTVPHTLPKDSHSGGTNPTRYS